MSALLPQLTLPRPATEPVCREQGAADKRGAVVATTAGGGPGRPACHRGGGPVPRAPPAGRQQGRVRRLHTTARVSRARAVERQTSYRDRVHILTTEAAFLKEAVHLRKICIF